MSDEDEMTRSEAKAYLQRKGKDLTEDNIKAVTQRGRIFGDPLIDVEF